MIAEDSDTRVGTSDLMTAAPVISLRNLVKTFGEVTAVDHLNLDIPAGSFMTLLGPSGCGKSTTLRLIGGFEHPDAGEVVIQGEDMGRTPPHARDTSMVFQSYALFPHMTVRENIGFGLRERKIDSVEIQDRVQKMLDLIELPDIADRKPQQLSGGQQQRVALARSLVVEPTVLLLDEPLGALDSNLRQQMQFELKRIQQQIGITFVYVTHDQVEALTMSDRIVVMRDGRVEQEGTPEEIFDRPISRYVAEFMGATNLLRVQVESQDARTTMVRIAGRRLMIPHSPPNMAGDAELVIRPERIRLDAEDGWRASVVSRTYRGSSYSYQLALDDGSTLVANAAPDHAKTYEIGDEVRVDFRGDAASLVPLDRESHARR